MYNEYGYYDEENLDNGGMDDGFALVRDESYKLLSYAFVNKGGVTLIAVESRTSGDTQTCLRFTFSNDANEEEQIALGGECVFASSWFVGTEY